MDETRTDEQKIEVLPYSIDALINQFASNARVSEDEIAEHIHTTYFQEYFDAINATIIVVEYDYVDHDFLEDYSEYYVRCFREYSRKCRRLHFFQDINFSTEDFFSLLSGLESSINESDLRSNYLGFVVAKPLPKTVVGRTCLKTYESDGRRTYPVTRAYNANLFGINLEVKATLAYQEQDKVVAACATSALWSVFQGTGVIFQHAIPSPSQITKYATEFVTTEKRPFPNSGLDAVQMAHAIKCVGLEQNPISVLDKNEQFDEFALKATSYAYLSAGIPMLLGIDVYDTCSNPPGDMGKHAVAVTGFSLDESMQPAPYKDDKFLLKASKIDKLYVHDDQIGPFARMEFDGTHVQRPSPASMVPDLLPSMSSSWGGLNVNARKIGCGRVIPEMLLIPLYHKIRIPFGTILSTIVAFDSLVKAVSDDDSSGNCPDIDCLEWDLKLATINEFKTKIKNQSLTPDLRLHYLRMPMPKYIWCATVTSRSDLLMDLIFDATDIEQGTFFIGPIEYSPIFAKYFREAIKVAEPTIDPTFKRGDAWAIAEWFINAEDPK